MLPKSTTNYYRYEGSLTTPSCGEAVIWTVFEQSIPISLDQAERFKTVFDDEGQQLTHNYRHIQPLNSRALVYVRSTTDNSGTMKITLPTSLIAASVFIAIFKSNYF
jgi:carbonic anhydrase